MNDQRIRAAGSAAALVALAAWAGWAHGAEAVIVVQRSPLAGFRHYEAPRLWRELAPGHRLALVREHGNAHDSNAVRVEWNGRMLGYLPRRDNAAVARQLDRGAVLEARVAMVRENRNHTVRVDVEIVAPLR